MHKKTKNKHRVKVRTLNEFRDIERCNFLKIDVELMELSVLKGAYLFSCSAPLLLIIFGFKIIANTLIT